MRKARYDMKQVVCRNSSCIGYSSNIAKPGYWIEFMDPCQRPTMGRVLGRIAETDRDGKDCVGFLAVVKLGMSGTHAHVNWIDPDDVIDCYEHPPKELLAWITGDQWVKTKHDIARIIAMSEYGTLGEHYIASRDDPEKAYNARPQYVKQFILE